MLSLLGLLGATYAVYMAVFLYLGLRPFPPSLSSISMVRFPYLVDASGEGGEKFKANWGDRKRERKKMKWKGLSTTAMGGARVLYAVCCSVV